MKSKPKKKKAAVVIAAAMPEKAWTKERRLYFFICDECGNKDRQTFSRRRAKVKKCRKCRRGPQIDPNQRELFPARAMPEKQ